MGYNPKTIGSEYGEEIFFSDSVTFCSNYKMIWEVEELPVTEVKKSITMFNSQDCRPFQGVPMGGNVSPDLADLTLSALMYKFFM